MRQHRGQLLNKLLGAQAVFAALMMRLRRPLGCASQYSALFFAIALGFAGATSFAQTVMSVPALTARVIDQTGTLTTPQIALLEQTLAEFERNKGSQIVVLMVPTTQPEEISSYANRVGNAWKLGRKTEGDGVLLIVAKNDRRIRIEVAKSLEGAIPDLAAKQIIDSAISPNFKVGNYAAGLGAATDLLMARIAAEALPEGAKAGASAYQSSGHGANPLADLDWLSSAVFLLFAVPFSVSVASAFLGRKLGSVAAGAAVGGLAFFITASIALAVVGGGIALAWALLAGTGAAHGVQSGLRNRRGFDTSRNGWGNGWGSSSGGGGFGSSGGGGFSSGGGGDFGGGGSSGDW